MRTFRQKQILQVVVHGTLYPCNDLSGLEQLLVPKIDLPTAAPTSVMLRVMLKAHAIESRDFCVYIALLSVSGCRIYGRELSIHVP